MTLEPRAAKFARHVTDLARAFDVRLFVETKMKPHDAGAGRGYHPLFTTGMFERPSVGVVKVYPVIDDTTYSVALHELGHCLSPFGQLRTAHGSLPYRKSGLMTTKRDALLLWQEELAAWEWAQHFALEWTDLMTMVMEDALGSYRRALRKAGIQI